MDREDFDGIWGSEALPFGVFIKDIQVGATKAIHLLQKQEYGEQIMCKIVEEGLKCGSEYAFRLLELKQNEFKTAFFTPNNRDLARFIQLMDLRTLDMFCEKFPGPDEAGNTMLMLVIVHSDLEELP